MKQNVENVSQEEYDALVSERDQYREIALELQKEFMNMKIRGA